MLLRKVTGANIKFLLNRTFHQSPKVCSIPTSGKQFPKFVADTTGSIPSSADILIVGGAAMGSSTAYWLKEKANDPTLSIVVLERDLTYGSCSTCLSNGGLRQQFSLRENIQLSLFGAHFMKTLKQRFGPDADVNFMPHGYLVLAGEEGAEQLLKNYKLQQEVGAVNVLLQKDQLKERFPYINMDDIVIGCLGLEGFEGWFDPWSLLQLLKNGAIKKGTQYVNANVVDFNFEDRKDPNECGHGHPKEVVIETPDGERKTINFGVCVLAAGPECGKVAELLKIGTGQGILSVPVPVERRKRYVYSFSCREVPLDLKTPMVIDSTGAYFRRDRLGGDFIGGINPLPEEEPETETLDVNHEFWDKNVWPVLAHRVPAFNAVKVQNAWGGFYEFNRFDENGIIGRHPCYTNIYMATGFSGHGIQQSPAVGRAMAELILDGKFKTIDLTEFGFERLLTNHPKYEVCIY